MQIPELSKLDAIIFDFGGVIINVDYKLTEEAFKKLGVREFDKLYSQAQQSRLFDDLETGRIAPREFRDRMRELCRLPFDDHAIDTAWNAMLMDLPAHRLDLIEKLKQTHKVFLLSNTNVIHMKFIDTYLDMQGMKHKFYEAFHQIYFSFEMKKRKPDPDTFLTVIDDHNLDPSKTLFIDDSSQHIEGAKNVGLKTLFLEKGKDISELFTS